MTPAECIVRLRQFVLGVQAECKESLSMDTLDSYGRGVMHGRRDVAETVDRILGQVVSYRQPFAPAGLPVHDEFKIRLMTTPPTYSLCTSPLDLTGMWVKTAVRKLELRDGVRVEPVLVHNQQPSHPRSY